MGLPSVADDYAGQSVDDSLGGVPVSTKTLQLELLVSEDERRRLQDQIFLLEDRLAEGARRIELYRAEAKMNAQGLRRCAEEKAATASGYADLSSRRAKLEEECTLYEGDVARLMESCDDLGRENEELKLQLRETSSVGNAYGRCYLLHLLPIQKRIWFSIISKCFLSERHTALASEVDCLRKDKENLRINLHRAEEEVKVLFKENTALDKENKTLLEELERGCHGQGSGGKHSAGSAPKVRVIKILLLHQVFFSGVCARFFSWLQVNMMHCNT
ncbi:hypothetical protein Taro_052638 [Colocasia esculenta]|uniref:Uncharacterized protein n=1 Tax=Colocasia esculenta TaxID=4460 RepID=A0A843XKC2_COLES|nr:hypothetical protein [Colocasia esculenta]